MCLDGVFDEAEAEAAAPDLGLPRGTIRTLFLLAVAYGAWLWFRENPSFGDEVLPIVLVVGGFVAGVLERWFLALFRRPDDMGAWAVHHLQALIALIAVGGIVVVAVLDKRGEMADWMQPALAGLVTFYFGAR